MRKDYKAIKDQAVLNIITHLKKRNEKCGLCRLTPLSVNLIVDYIRGLEVKIEKRNKTNSVE